MADPRWEKERAAWVLARAGRNRAARRRGEKLASVARRQDRYAAGVGDTAFGEVATRNVFHRSVFREEGAANTAGWLLWTLSWMGWGALLLGPAYLLSLVLYGLWWLRRTPMRPSWPLLAAGVVAALGVGGLWVFGPADLWGRVLWAYIIVQLVLGLMRLAWMTRAYGWPAVARTVRARTGDVSTLVLPDIDDIEMTDELTPAAPEPAVATPVEQNTDTDAVGIIEIDMSEGMPAEGASEHAVPQGRRH